VPALAWFPVDADVPALPLVPIPPPPSVVIGDALLDSSEPQPAAVVKKTHIIKNSQMIIKPRPVARDRHKVLPKNLPSMIYLLKHNTSLYYLTFQLFKRRRSWFDRHY
jgi:hypothetical protein